MIEFISRIIGIPDRRFKWQRRKARRRIRRRKRRSK
jgi:hypothetical protein